MYSLIAVASGVLFAEVAGYFIHILLHSQKIEFLSKNHMIHHLVVYGPKRSLRAPTYQASSEGRARVGKIGMEWIAPIGAVVGLAFLILWTLDVSAFTQLIFVTSGVLWGYIGFSYMHQAMHLQGFWMGRVPILNRWFHKVRRLHDIHHLRIDDSGKMTVNYGICFFFLDRLFGSFIQKHSSFNKQGLDEAYRRYAFIFK